MRVRSIAVVALLSALSPLSGVAAGAASAPSITVTPSTHVLDGQLVTLAGAGFTPGADLLMGECQAGVTSLSQCDQGFSDLVVANASGGFSVGIQVAREFVLGSTTVDCAKAGACVMGAVNENDVTQLATTPITFKDVPIVPPTVTVTPDTALVDGQSVVVKAAHFTAGASVYIQECPTTAPPVSCQSQVSQTAVVDGTGHTNTTVTVARLVGTPPYGAGVDCAVAPGCSLIVTNPASAALQSVAVPLTFNPAVPPLPALKLAVKTASTATLVAGEVHVHGTVSCNRAVSVNLFVQVSQGSAFSAMNGLVPCSGNGSRWSLVVPTATGGPLAAGLAFVETNASAQSGSSSASVSVNSPVTLVVPPG
jgi:hypothetical protein